jgi:hypothetical protein
MKDLYGFDLLLGEIGPLAAEARAETQRRAMMEAPEFRALSFFRPGEVIATDILAYLLTPSAPHGQTDRFLKSFLSILGLDLGISAILSVSVKTNAPCYTLGARNREQPLKRPLVETPTIDFTERSGYPLMDILIEFRIDKDDYVVVIESKSHGAGDQPNQVRDYLRHIRTAYRLRKKYLFYLNDGQPPQPISILREDWSAGVKDGICQDKAYQEVMESWIKECCINSPSRLQFFLIDFAAYLDLEAHNTVAIDSQVRTRVADIIDKQVDAENSHSHQLDAILAIYEMHQSIPLYAIKHCLERACAVLKTRHKDWQVDLQSDYYSHEPYVWMKLYKARWAGKIWIYLGSQDDSKSGCHFDLCIFKSPNFPSPVDSSFDECNHLRIGTLKKEEYVRRPMPLGKQNLRSAEAIRALLTVQAVMDIVTDVDLLIGEYETTLDNYIMNS